MRFSIITITYNSATYLAETIESVLSQDYADFEYLLVDGGSTDDTLAIIQHHAKMDSRIRWTSEPDKGIADAMNKGIRLAQGDIISHLHSDDTYLDGALRAVADAFSHNRDARWLTGCLRYVDKRGDLLYDTHLKRDYSLDSLLRQNIIGHPATFIHREVFAQVGGFSLDCRYAMDYDMWLRIASCYPVLPLPVTLATFRSHEQSLSSREILKALAEDYRIRRRYRTLYGHGGGFSDLSRYCMESLAIYFGLNNLRKRLRARLNVGRP